VFDRFDQQGDRFPRGRQGRGRARRRGPLGHLRPRLLGIGGQIDKVSLVLAALEAGVGVKMPEEGTGIQAQAPPQFGGGQSGRRLLDQRHERLGQMARPGKANILMKPQPVRIKLGDVGQGVKPAIVIETGQTAPGFEPAPDGAHRSVEVVGEFGQGEDLALSPKAK
jgi:hypothetical protein